MGAFAPPPKLAKLSVPCAKAEAQDAPSPIVSIIVFRGAFRFGRCSRQHDRGRFKGGLEFMAICLSQCLRRTRNGRMRLRIKVIGVGDSNKRPPFDPKHAGLVSGSLWPFPALSARAALAIRSKSAPRGGTNKHFYTENDPKSTKLLTQCALLLDLAQQS